MGRALNLLSVIDASLTDTFLKHRSLVSHSFGTVFKYDANSIFFSCYFAYYDVLDHCYPFEGFNYYYLTQTTSSLKFKAYFDPCFQTQHQFCIFSRYFVCCDVLSDCYPFRGSNYYYLSQTTSS